MPQSTSRQQEQQTAKRQQQPRQPRLTCFDLCRESETQVRKNAGPSLTSLERSSASQRSTVTYMAPHVKARVLYCRLSALERLLM